MCQTLVFVYQLPIKGLLHYVAGGAYASHQPMIYAGVKDWEDPVCQVKLDGVFRKLYDDKYK